MMRREKLGYTVGLTWLANRVGRLMQSNGMAFVVQGVGMRFSQSVAVLGHAFRRIQRWAAAMLPKYKIRYTSLHGRQLRRGNQ